MCILLILFGFFGCTAVHCTSSYLGGVNPALFANSQKEIAVDFLPFSHSYSCTNRTNFVPIAVPEMFYTISFALS